MNISRYIFIAGLMGLLVCSTKSMEETLKTKRVQVPGGSVLFCNAVPLEIIHHGTTAYFVKGKFVNDNHEPLNPTEKREVANLVMLAKRQLASGDGNPSVQQASSQVYDYPSATHKKVQEWLAEDSK